MAAVGAAIGSNGPATPHAATTSAAASGSAAAPRTTPTTAQALPAPWRWWDAQAGLAYRWLKPSEFHCAPYAKSCWGLAVISRDGCPSSLYAEVSVQNKNDVVIGFANDLVGAVTAGKTAALVLDTAESGDGITATLSKLSCH